MKTPSAVWYLTALAATLACGHSPDGTQAAAEPTTAETATTASQPATAREKAALATAPDDTAIHPFHVRVPESALTDLRARLLATRWPERETVTDDTQGVQLATAQALQQYWATSYDWRKVEARLNALPQFTTQIDGLTIHFIHVRSKNENAMPLIITHGWPGSIIEMLKVIDLLTNPTAHGASASDAFDLVIPSMPGYGFSGKPTSPGWDPNHIASAWITLMRRLGYTHFAAQGGDWGDLVTELMALQAPPELLGIHVNMPFTVPPDVASALKCGYAAPASLQPDETRAFAQLDDFYSNHAGYAAEMASRPQTLYGLMDSPVGLASWMIDHDIKSYELIAGAFAGNPGGLSRDDVLDDVTLYWLTRTAISSARLYWENKVPLFDVLGVQIPVAVSVFPDEIYEAPRTWAEAAYPKLIYYNVAAKGGHFAAWQVPELFSEEVRAGLRSLR